MSTLQTNKLVAALMYCLPRLHRHLVTTDEVSKMEQLVKDHTDYYQLTSAELIVHAYEAGESNGGSVDWGDVNLAYQRARDEIGLERLNEIREVYGLEPEEEEKDEVEADYVEHPRINTGRAALTPQQLEDAQDLS